MVLPVEIPVIVSMFLAIINVLIMEFHFNDTLARPVVSVLTCLGITTIVYSLVGVILQLLCQTGIELNQGICIHSQLRVGSVIILIVAALISSIMVSVTIYINKRKNFH